MGKLNYESHIQHFSHEHPLELTSICQQHYPSITRATTCSGCKEGASPSDQWIYTCKSCNFNLHIPCAQMPRHINHPLDPNHPLFLFPSPAYPGGFFNCDACGRQNNTGFSYHCTVCSLDLHILCATKPATLSHQAHPLNHAVYPPQGVFGQQPQPQPQPKLVLQGVGHQGIPVINNNMAPPQQQQRIYDNANSSPSMGSVHELFMNSQQAYNQQLQQHLEQLKQQQQRANDSMATTYQEMFAGASQKSQNILQSILGGGNNGGHGVASDIFQGILGGGNNGGSGGGASDIFQSILGGGNNGGHGVASDIFQGILGGGNNGGSGGGASDIFQSILGGGNNGGHGVASDIFQGILGGGNNGGRGGGASDIFQSILRGGNSSGSGASDISPSILGGGPVGPSTATLNSTLNSVNQSLDVLGTIGATDNYKITYQSNSRGGGGYGSNLSSIR